MSLWRVIPDHLVLALGWTLLHFLWQGALVAMFLAVANRVFDRDASGPRYALAAVAMLVMVALPIGTFMTLAQDFDAERPTVHRYSIERAVESEGTESPDRWAAFIAEPSGVAGAVRSDAGSQGVIEPHGLDDQGGWTHRIAADRAVAPETLEQAFASDDVPSGGAWFSIQRAATITLSVFGAMLGRALASHAPAWLPWFVGLWGLGVSLLTLRLLGGWFVAQRIKRTVIAGPSDHLQRTLEALCVRMSVSRPVQMFRSALVEVPTVIGWLRPVVLMPVSAFSGLTPGQIEALLAHELAHIRRHDYLVNLLQTVVETVLFYHPAVWWVSRRVREERENCCDDLAVEACGDRVAYARALCELERLRAPAPALTLAASGGSLLHRILRLVQPAPRTSLLSRCGAGVLVTGALLIVVLGLAPAASDDRGGPLIGEAGFAVASVEYTSAPVAPVAPSAPRARAPHPPRAVAPDKTQAPAPIAPPDHGVSGDRQAPPAPRANPPVWYFVPHAPEAPAAPHAREPALAPVAPSRDLPFRAPVPPRPEAAPRPGSSGAPRWTPAPEAPAAPGIAVGRSAMNTWLTSARSIERDARIAARHMMIKDSQRTRPRRAEMSVAQGPATPAPMSYQMSSVPSMLPAPVLAPVPSRSYQDEMRRAGYGVLDEEDLQALSFLGVGSRYAELMAETLGEAPDPETLLGLHMMGVTPDYVREIIGVFGEQIEYDDLIGLHNLGVTPAYASSMRGVLSETPDPDDLMGLMSQGVTPDDVREMTRRAGGSLSAEDLIELKAGSGTPGYAWHVAPHVGEVVDVEHRHDSHDAASAEKDALQKLGINPDERSLVELRSHGISLGYVAQMRHHRGHDLTLDQLIVLHENGIEPEDVGALNVLGYRDLPVRELVSLAGRGTSVERIAQLNAAFGRQLSIPELLKLEDHGVGVEYAANMSRLRGAELNVDEIVVLHQHGVPSAYVSALVAIDYPHRGVGDVARLSDHGVRPAYLKSLAEIGYGAIPPGEVTRLYDAGLSAKEIVKLNRAAGKKMPVSQLLNRQQTAEADCEE